MSNNNNVHCIKGTIPFLFSWFNREVTVCQKYSPKIDLVHYDEAFNELIDTPGFTKTDEYYLQNGLYHRPEEFGPAHIEYSNHSIIRRAYYRYGLLHREKEPALIYNMNGNSYNEYFRDGVKQTQK